MNKSILMVAALLLGSAITSAQTLSLPPEVQKAYDNDTRAKSGKPGKKYWENHGRYVISISAAPPDRTIKGVETITYFNNSPDVLKQLNMKLIVNVHRAGLRGRAGDPAQGISIDEFKANGANVAWDNNADTTTNQMIDLPKPLMPHDSVKLNISWHYQLSRGRGRDGAINPSTFYLAYFYPRVSVYDDYRGWDTQPHTGGLEFYNDFNDYTLNVTVPKNFIVWATGDLRNAKQVLQPAALKRYEASLKGDSTVHVAAAQDLADKTVTAQNATNTWTFTSTNITDVATAISDNYNWDAASVSVNDKTGYRVSVQAAFPDSSQDFHHSVQFSRYALGWFSRNWPGVQYPFPKSTAVQGFADMEYPMMVNDSHEKDLVFAELVQDHEQAHTYFPFYMGINESRYAFMDEGWATTLEYLIGITEKGQKAADNFYKSFRVTRWIHANHDKEQPVITPSPDVTRAGGGGDNAYGKPSMSYLALKDMLGDDLFKKALHTYMDNWHGKHPIPWDYFNSMSTGSGKDLTWFFYNWFYTPSYIDIALDKAEPAKQGYLLSIKNIGGFAIPFDVVATYADGSTERFHQTPMVWEKDQKQTTITVKATKALKSLTLETGIYMDANEKDNAWIAQ
ncbi:aminopeptidase [Mucilaginibacter sp. PPCGB 2223]|uniref:M1 family metallopeptidase n=1 Tax=Mucilaginibacter sp. PPCGB 2223 TaxID=1886027 RepID=UPI00082620F3|nr:M1 family metallopeptidase [Mucilaginibacter sp. PPCGB 2223]OCX51781.1 aminopeptidase [Mucilaginibacter sp. PPCGB 2223]